MGEPCGRNHKLFGEMAEWFMAAVLKTVVGLHLTGGSNPSLSVVVLYHTKNVSRLKPLMTLRQVKNGKMAEWLKAHPC